MRGWLRRDWLDVAKLRWEGLRAMFLAVLLLHVATYRRGEKEAGRE